ncbi:MAG: hypothetical protein FIA99_07250 [Ruminiclostridium sp.]|nr:hypothetical protein [Ruminiclostridium sp.]
MLNSLNIDCYENSYSPNHVSCFAIPVGAACGYYNYDNYYYYLFYHCINENWPNKKIHGLDRTVDKLSKLGLTIKLNRADNADEFVASIKSKIDNQSFVIMPAVYIYLFYFPQYKNNPTTHFFIISGYDPQRSAIQIRDTIRDFVLTPGLYVWQMHESLLKEIRTSSNNFFKEKGPDNLCDIFYNIEKVNESKINSYKDLTNDFLLNYDPDHSKLASLVAHFPDFIDSVKKNNHGTSLFIRRELCYTTAVMFDCFEKAFDFEKKDTEELTELHIFKEQYINFRDKIVTKIYAEALREKDLGKGEREIIINDILLMDRKLFSFIRSLSEGRI